MDVTLAVANTGGGGTEPGQHGGVGSRAASLMPSYNRDIRASP